LIWPLPDQPRLREIVDGNLQAPGKDTYFSTEAGYRGLDATAANLRGLTEEEAERAIFKRWLPVMPVPDTITDVLEAKKDLLRRSGMLEFIDASQNLAPMLETRQSQALAGQRRGAWEGSARQFV